jgi:FkbM family methyltransferase
MAGPNYYMFVARKGKYPPFSVNTRIYSCNLIRNDVPFRWRGRYNEDTILSLDMLKADWCTIQFYAFLQYKTTTQILKGGNTKEFYDKEGTMPKSQMLVDVHPDVSRIKWKYKRWHHYVNYEVFDHKLVRKPNLEVTKGPDEYGMVLESVDQQREIEVKGVKAVVRAGTSDEFVVNEVIKGNTYRRLTINPGDTVLDAGMNIGMFTILASRAGATVHSFEPDPDNFQLAKTNIELNDLGANVTLNECAITGTDEPEREFSLNLKRNKGAHSLVKKRGRNSIRVKAEHIDSVIRRVKPTVIKMDIEGGEFECIQSVTDLTGVRELIMEFHHAHLNENEPGKPRPCYQQTLARLREFFDVVEFKEEPKKAWVTLIYCKNEPQGGG